MIHDARPARSCASWAGHSNATWRRAPWVICHANEPRLVQGVCQAVTLIMSGQMIFRPAPHMPVNWLHRLQKPSRIATWSLLTKPQSGHVQLAAARIRRKNPRL